MMGVIILEPSINNKFQNNEGIIEFLSTMGKKAVQWGQTIGCVFKYSELADEVGVSRRTIQRYVAELRETGLIDVETKRGNRGGVIMTFNSEMLDFKTEANVITEETADIEDLKGKYFPEKKKPKRHYRSKAEIARERALQKVRQDEIAKLNDELKAMPYPSEEFFENFSNPEIALKAYLISRIYNAYVLIFPRERANFNEGRNEAVYNEASKTYRLSQGYDVLPKGFVGDPRWNKFVEVAEFCETENVDPFEYLTAQFKYCDFRKNLGHSCSNAPFVNTLLTEESKNRYYKNVYFYDGIRVKNPFFSISGKTEYVGAGYPIIQTLRKVYNKAIRTADPLVEPMKELEISSFGDDRARAIMKYIITVTQDLKESGLSQDKQQLIIKFVKQQALVGYKNNFVSPSTYVTTCPLQVKQMEVLGTLHKLDDKDINLLVGNTEVKNTFTQSGREYTEDKGSLIRASLSDSTSFDTICWASELRGQLIIPRELGEALSEYGTNKVPMNKAGMLDLGAIVKKFQN